MVNLSMTDPMDDERTPNDDSDIANIISISELADALLPDNDLLADYTPNEGESLRNQPNFAVFRQRYIDRLKGQLQDLDRTLKAQALETEAIQTEEETNADWMWDVQQNYARLEKDTAAVSAQRLQLTNALMDLQEELVGAEKVLSQEEKYKADLLDNEKKNQGEIQQLNDYYHKYYQEKEQTYKDAKIVDVGITRQKKELVLAKLQKRHLDFEVYRYQRQIISAEERLELRAAIQRQRLDDLAALRQEKLETEAELELLQQQSGQVSRALTADMRVLAERNQQASGLSQQLKASGEAFRHCLAECNGYRKDIRALQAEHEHLTLVTIRASRELLAYERRIEGLNRDMEILYNKHGEMSRLTVALNDKADALTKYENQRQRELQDIRETLTSEIKKKNDAEMALHETLMENKSFTKGARYSQAEFTKLSEKLSQLEEDAGQQDYEIAQQAILRIELTNETETRSKEMQQLADKVKQREQRLKDAVTALEHESSLIDRRQDKINRLQAKLDALIAASGGEEVRPIEIQLANLQSEIQASEEQYRKLKNDWLRYQTSIVRLTEQRDNIKATATDLDNQAFIANYKLNRLNKEIGQIDAECAEYAKTDKKIQENIARASQQLFRFNQQEQETVMKALDAEHAAIEGLRKEEVRLEEEKARLEQTAEQLKNIEQVIYDTKEKTLMWERKLELKKHAKKSLEEDFNQEELENLKNEVHKLQLDKQALEKEQLKVTQEMLFSAERRDQLHSQSRRRVLEGEAPSLKKLQQIVERKSKEVQRLQKELRAVQIFENDCRKRLDLGQKAAELQTDAVNNLEGVWKGIIERKGQLLKERFQVRLENFVAQQYGKLYLGVRAGRAPAARRIAKATELSDLNTIITDLQAKTDSLQKVIDAIGERHPGIYEDKKAQTATTSRSGIAV
ncbi:coiled-coil domain-containing protein 40-like [Paramacrobiotus metropolitanus]|uniref:coiled-coil domain-containing protein 40-like n=1 Tax=Paramacrobiotus metropolitanus TaxID=2943436 RepID=UPI00244622F3|nr:coiled-coil domain-containing protein 40-like [Paramacrobiotus metropolitanus]XP_055341656.1 coiled-coil domain-containing protein 40-like [Paramacrobiotus metropolitanus]